MDESINFDKTHPISGLLAKPFNERDIKQVVEQTVAINNLQNN